MSCNCKYCNPRAPCLCCNGSGEVKLFTGYYDRGGNKIYKTNRCYACHGYGYVLVYYWPSKVFFKICPTCDGDYRGLIPAGGGKYQKGCRRCHEGKISIDPVSGHEDWILPILPHIGECSCCKPPKRYFFIRDGDNYRRIMKIWAENTIASWNSRYHS